MASASSSKVKLDQTHFDVLLVGTDLPTSILSAALARAGKSVLHIDQNDYYGGVWAGLTLRQLVQWCEKSRAPGGGGESTTGKETETEDISFAFPYFENDTQSDQRKAPPELPQILSKLDRHYSLALTPTLVASTGPSIDALVRSKVASYSTFRLLEQTVVFIDTPGQGSQLQRVPSSKEDVFKDRSLSLIEKRKLMKFLQSVMGQDSAGESERETASSTPYDEYLRASYGLSDKLITALSYGISLLPHRSSPSPSSSQPARSIPTSLALARAKRHLASIGRYGNAAYLVGQYGGAGELAQGYCRASAVMGATFMLDVGIEERLKFVKGEGGDGRKERWEMQVDSVDGKITADWTVFPEQHANDLIDAASVKIGRNQASRDGRRVARGVVILDRAVNFSAGAAAPSSSSSEQPQQQQEQKPAEVVETALIIFPPGSCSSQDPDDAATTAVASNRNTQTVQVLMMGEGTFSCPKGQYVYYLVMDLPPQPDDTASDASAPTAEELLEPYVKQLLRLTEGSRIEWQAPEQRRPAAEEGEAVEMSKDDCKPLFTLFFTQNASGADHEGDDLLPKNCTRVAFPPPAPATSQETQNPRESPYELPPSLAEYTDFATSQAESIFWNILAATDPTVSAPRAGDNVAPSSSSHADCVLALKRRAAEKARRRGKKRSAAEFQGRAGAFSRESDDQNSIGDHQEVDGQERAVYGAKIEGVEWDEVVEFFEPPEDDGDGEVEG